MTERERQILALLRDDPTLSAAAIARRLKSSAAAVTVHLSALRQQGEIIGRGYVLKPAGQVVVIGGANMDFKCQAKAPMVLRTSNPGRMAATVGGVACNIARNLARLGAPTALFTVVGQDEFGERILREARAAGIDTSMTLLSGKPTGTYVALLDRDGDLTAAISAMDAMEELTPQRIGARAAALAQARMVVADCNLEQAALAPPRGAVRRREGAAGDRCRLHPQGRAAATAPEGQAADPSARPQPRRSRGPRRRARAVRCRPETRGGRPAPDERASMC